LSMFRDAAVSRGMVEAQTTLSERMGQVAQDVAEKAVNHVRACGCTLTDVEGAPDPACPECHGQGKVFREGSLKHAELVFESTGLTRRGGGVNVNVRQQMGVALGGAFLERFVKATDDAALDVVEGETVG